jgi:hypothetical protein
MVPFGPLFSRRSIGSMYFIAFFQTPEIQNLKKKCWPLNRLKNLKITDSFNISQMNIILSESSKKPEHLLWGYLMEFVKLPEKL